MPTKIQREHARQERNKLRMSRIRIELDRLSALQPGEEFQVVSPKGIITVPALAAEFTALVIRWSYEKELAAIEGEMEESIKRADRMWKRWLRRWRAA